MVQIFVGVGQASLFIRHARTLKDRRQIVKGLKQRLVNLGFSACEDNNEADPRQASVGFTFVATEHSTVECAMDQAKSLFIGDFDVTSLNKDIFDYSDIERGEVPWHSEFR